MKIYLEYGDLQVAGIEYCTKTDADIPIDTYPIAPCIEQHPTGNKKIVAFE